MSSPLASIDQLVAQLESLVPQGTTPAPSDKNIATAQDVIRKLKLELVKFHSSPPYSESELVQVRSVLLAQRRMLESGAFLSLYSRDIPAFQRYMAQLKTSYNDLRALLPPSKAQAPLLGAYLLCLLAQNHIADFHTEYELLAHTATSAAPGSGSVSGASSAVLPPTSPTSSRSVSTSALLSSSFVAFPVSLEQQLMEGCYSQILAAAAGGNAAAAGGAGKGKSNAVPLPVYELFLEQLARTVRTKIADCSEQAYPSVSLKDLAQLLHLAGGEKEARQFAETRKGWTVDADNTVHFGSKSAAAQQAASTEINALKTIAQTLAYATELERIV